MPRDKGMVNTWNTEKQFGFVSCNNAREDLFLHAENISNLNLREEIKNRGFQRGDRIRFDIEPPVTGRGKMVAMNVEMDKGKSRSPSPRKRRSPSPRRRGSPSPQRPRQSRSRSEHRDSGRREKGRDRCDMRRSSRELSSGRSRDRVKYRSRDRSGR
uniref:CSD domain-containing protein n=1 Tax=Noctiluca scintillans TaxID=2966 RepID=A0A7S1AW56_NOCSC|mmetsp:Transcript_6290/g.17525  ORF Transcript_6290/g.17525 Transcript_6290/m.17525 type:complete len:157 (+) Transcript_6290:165-635(+)